MDFFRNIRLFFSRRTLQKCVKKIIQDTENKLWDDFLETLLRLMSLSFIIDPSFARDIKDFDAGYVFKSKDGKIQMGVRFIDGTMRVSDKAISSPNITIEFADQSVLRDMMFSGDADILNYMLENKISYQGNLNYILKFGYLAKHLQLQFTL